MTEPIDNITTKSGLLGLRCIKLVTINNNTQTNDFNTSATGGNLIEVTGVYFTDS